MGNEYQGKKVNFGTDSERYLASLFKMRQEHRGSRFPDLMTDSTKKSYTPHLAMESKSGKYGGKLLAEQLAYAISTRKQYREWFGEDPGKLEGWLEGEDPFLETPYYLFYNNILRADDLTSLDIDKDFAAIKMQWGDQYIIPAEVLFAYFISRLTQKDGGSIDDAKKFLVERTRRRISSESSLFGLRKDQREFQNFEICYSMAFFNKTGTAGANTDLRKRVIEGVYAQLPDLDNYPRANFTGPCGTHVYMIGSKKFPGLIDQVGESIDERREILSEIGDERRAALSLLDKIEPSVTRSLFCNGKLTESRRKILRSNLTLKQISWLERLTAWKSEEDVAREKKLPTKPEDDVPF